MTGKAVDDVTLEFMTVCPLEGACYIKVPHLIDTFPDLQPVLSPLVGEERVRDIHGGGGFLPETIFAGNQDYLLAKVWYRQNEGIDPNESPKLTLGGPRLQLYNDP
jgi:hypothetical protein